MTLPVLVEVVRSGYRESSHSGSVVALTAHGSRALALGDLARPVFPRSSNKPLQAVGLLRAGWRPRDDREVALATASHNGEDAHVDVVRQMLGDDEAALGCPAMLPLSEAAGAALLARGEQPSPLTMNCSGKHAAMLATCRERGWPLRGYLDLDAPVQRAVLAAVEDLAGEPVQRVAVDGCGAPQHALTLPGLARAFATIAAAAPGTPERRVADAMRAHPDLVGGTGRDVTALLRAVPGLVAKDGAEGVYAAALPDGRAVALKIEDGASRGRMPVLAAGLRALGVPVPDELATLPVLGGGAVVGEVRAAGALAEATAAARNRPGVASKSSALAGLP